ncbi:hypothetical protein GGU10DRAFT_310805 [Lentinula aff. detonsa]|uniref:BRCT domain-containing protein n=1 Tax=Lentinula aff. detonsa TaxID=2804958 RepID=A0AA38KFE9_9AGAR|nr:hypothetical protein GGU10DRAFT_310805 [Lentinula aff. detonsa]
MRRRGNKSAKVPGVKLRPAQPGASSSRSYTESDAIRVQDSQVELDSDDTRYYDPTPRPFAGLVLCATGITDKPGIFKQAVELGATTTSDFTTRVTHLIANEHGSAKYRCALEHKVPILQPSWITESYNIWLHGDDVDFKQSIKRHRLPIFSGVVICVSGIPDVNRRTEIGKIVMREGGSYVKALQRPVIVTHLLCSGDEETDKMFYAEKFNKRGEADIKLVWEEWFWDSLEFGGRFDESVYQARQPRPKPRNIVEPAIPSSSSTQGQSANNAALAGTQNAAISGKALNSNAEGEEELVQASVRKPIGFQKELWRSVLAPRGYTWNEEETVLVKSPTKHRPHALPLEEEEDENAYRGRRGGSVLSSSSFRRANSFAQLPSKQPLRRLLSTRMKDLSAAVVGDDAATGLRVNAAMELDTPGAGPSTPRSSIAPEDIQPPSTASIFSGLRFAALGEANCDNVCRAIREAGGTLVESVDLEAGAHEVDIIVVRLVSGSNLFASIHSPSVQGKFRTECWLEKCLHKEIICPPDDHITFTPVGVQCPIAGADNVRISFSGFDEAERFFMTRLMKVLGLTLLSNFSKRATHLLCPSAEGLKFEKAREWGIPVVGMAWLQETKRNGLVPDVQEYLVPQSQLDGNPEEHDLKGKRKATETDLPIADITNCVESQSQTQDDSQLFEFPPQLDHLPQLQPTTHPRPPISAAPSLSKLSLNEIGSFGKPTTLLQVPRPPVKDVQAPSSISEPEERGVSVPTSFTSLDVPAMAQAHSSHSESDSNPLTSAETRPDAVMVLDSSPEEQMNVPSSNTPSPIKSIAQEVGKGKGRAFTRTKSTSKSPSKYYPPAQPIDSEATKALQESLTSLLGKRRSEESADGTRDGARRRGDRADGKRPRPMRTKSTTFNEIQKPPSDHAFHILDTDSGIDDSFGFGHPDTNVLDIESYQEQSIRVTYEDPEQRDEQRKLMRLLESESQDQSGNEKVKTRNMPKEGAFSEALNGQSSNRRTSRRSNGMRG